MKNIKRLLPRTTPIELKTNSDVSDYFYLTLVMGLGLFLSILAFMVSATYQYRETLQQFESKVTNVHLSLSSSAARHTLEFEFLAKSILDARHDNSLNKSDRVRKRIANSDFVCVLLAGPHRSPYDTVLKGGTPCESHHSITSNLIAKIRDEKNSPGTEFQNQIFADANGALYIGLVASLNYPFNQYLLGVFSVDSLFPKNMGSLHNSDFTTPEGVVASFKKNMGPSSALISSRHLVISGQDITVYYWPASGQHDVKIVWSWIILALGLIITVLLGAMIYNLIGKNMEVQKEVERKTSDLQVATIEAVRANQTKTRFLANVSHEVRTPLNLILGMADLLLETPLNHEQKRYVSTFKKSGTHLLEIINDILDVASLEVADKDTQNLPVDLIELVEGISDFVSVACRNKKIQFDYEIAPDLPRLIESNPKRLRQILLNLINNAMKFTDRGQILLGTEIQKAAINEEHDWIVFKVKDTGIGIPHDQLDKVYESFYQIDSSSTRGKGGVGLGLHIVRTCVDHLSGQIQVESEIGAGTTFRVLLPLKSREPGSWLDGLKGRHTPAEPQSVFLLTPNATQGKFIKTCLETIGYDVTVQTFGRNPLKAGTGSEKTYDFYLIDLVGQDVGGLEFLRRASWPATELRKTVILCPLVHRAGDFEALKAIGVQRLCHTPVKLRSLLACFREIRENQPGHFDAVAIPAAKPAATLKEKVRLLVAEDDEDNRFLIQAYLESYGFEISFAENGISALEQYKSRRAHFDLVITDIQMPRMDGFELIQKIRDWEKSQNLRRLPIIALTADAQPEQVENVKRLGCDEYLKKPISKADLLSALSHYQAPAAKNAS
jgi:signal transduction histidine kinase/CheY-like chemotaxis protein